jgi:UDP-glucuronate 4-epimerase
MKILVTGAGGFIGYHVAKALIARGDEVVAIDEVNNYYDVSIKYDRIKGLALGDKFYKFSLADIDKLKGVFRDHKFDVVCHLAAQAGVRYSIENPFAYEKANCLSTLNLFEVMKANDCKKLVFASSSSVYGGNTNYPFSEKDNVDNPISLYAATKKYCELMAHVYHKLFGFDCFGLRFFTVYGPMGRPDMALFKFTKNILDDKAIDVYNNGNHERDFTYVDDIRDGVIRSIDRVKGYEIFNLGNDNTINLMDFIGFVEKKLGRVAIKNMLPMQKGDVHKTSADISKARELLGWQPKVNVEEGISRFVEWYFDYYGRGDKGL